MKYIVGISAIAALGATLIYSVQNSDKAESKKIVKEKSSAPIAVIAQKSPQELEESPEENSLETDILMEAIASAKSEENAIKINKVSKRVAKRSSGKAVKTKLNQVRPPKMRLDSVKVSQAATNKTEIVLKENKPQEKKSPFSQIVDVTFNTDNKETSNGDKGYDTQLWYFLTYKINDTYRARLWVDITKDLADSYEEKLNNTKVTFSHKSIELAKDLKLSPSITTVFPTGEKSKRNEELNIGFEFNTSFSYKINDKVSVSYLPRFAKNFHEYKTSRTNSMNTEYKSVQFYSLSYAITDKLSFDPTLIYVNSWSYEGTRRSPSYLSILELGYQVDKSLSLSVGTLQGGSVFDRENGPNETVKVLDKNETTLYGNFALRF